MDSMRDEYVKLQSGGAGYKGAFTLDSEAILRF
jgi:hypothetical protein